MVKRVGNLAPKLTDPENIEEAVRLALSGRTRWKGVAKFLKDREENTEKITEMLRNGTYRSSEYRTFERKENGKVRHISALPFYPDRIVHWAVVLATRDVFMRTFISQTYASIPGRGTHQALTVLRGYLRDPQAKYCLKLDVHHFFESIDKEVLMDKLRRRIKDRTVLDLYEEIIMGYPGPGIPIGNLTSQWLANLYLNDIDHYMKEQYHAKWYLRYMDDIIVLGWSKGWLRRVKKKIEGLLADIGLKLNPRWQLFPVDARGVDFVGYRTFPRRVLLRRRTKTRLTRATRRISDSLRAGIGPDTPMRSCIASYSGILSWCDGKGLYRRYIRPTLELME